ncbi:MAG: insulinase family protein [Eubacteriaceae bacterium]|nr:insulinase family protein [Eubacteriaceae bacterium]
MKEGESYSGFTLSQVWDVGEIESTAHLFEHAKSGAKLLYLQNSDENKVFSVTFRTPSVDSCGTAHIIEHSLLCGSEKYPLKEPFVELLKSSLNTFLNAMTFPDKTMYPVASLNMQDLLNLSDVYLDAVFNPLIKTRKSIFLQEGWHYHLENESDPLEINGVVYSEMKGAYSSPMDTLDNEISKSLFPQTSYRFDSGGDPKAIPGLTYEKFLDFYNSYYHPSNSYIYLYGDMQVLPFLEKIDGFLAPYEKQDSSFSMPKLQPELGEQPYREAEYSLLDESDLGRSCYYAYNFKLGKATDSLLSYQVNVLDGILMDSDSSPLKKALLDSGIADEISARYQTSQLEPVYSIVAKKASEDSFDKFCSIIDDTLAGLCETGIDPGLIKSSLNSYEFDLREADSGGMPKGLLYSIDIMDSWLYGEMPTAHLEFERYLAILRENENSAYYESLIKAFFLENPNKTKVKLTGEIGLAEKRSEDLAEQLAAYKSSLSEEELSDIARTTSDLLISQSTPDSQEDRDKIPSLEVSDIDKVLPEPNFSIEKQEASNIFTHTANTRGIVYFDLCFDLSFSDAQDAPALELCTKILSEYKTLFHSEEDLAKLIGTYLGDTGSSIMLLPVLDTGGYATKFAFSIKALAANSQIMADIAYEILAYTLVDDNTRLMQTVLKEISKFEQRMVTAAHTRAVARIAAFETDMGAFAEEARGLGYYSFLLKAKASLESGSSEVATQLTSALEKALSSQPDILICCDEAERERAVMISKGLLARLRARGQEESHGPYEFKPLGKRNEAIYSSGAVNYVAFGTNYKNLGLGYSPYMPLVHKFLASGYLWNAVRVIGGAYGAMMTLDKSGNVVFVSYRDPKLLETLEAYKKVPEVLESLQMPDRDMSKLIIGTISDIDAPKPVYGVARSMLMDYYRHESWADRMQDRSALLSANQESIRSFAEFFRQAVAASSICVIGTKPQIEEASSSFDSIIVSIKDM